MSNWHVGQLKFALGLGSIMSFYGVVTFIVMMMPEGSVGRNQKIVVIVLVLLTMPFTLLGGYLAARRSRKKEEKAKAEAEAKAGEGQQAAQPTAAATTSAVAADATALAGLEEVVQFIKTSNLGSGGKDAIYSLPWYLVAGAPKAGKSSLVIGSNLNFQNLPSQRQSELKIVRPTPNVDWRVTSEGVFIDTAGRYGSEGIDGEEWAALLEAIRKYRPNRPIDGFILTVDVNTITKGDERQNEEHAKVLRARLDDTLQRLKVKFPVYLVFTQADSIEGFRDSFSASKKEDKTLVWGATIPIEKSENAQASFDSEFEVLQDAVMRRRLSRLSAPFPAVRQLRIFNFPLHFGAARRKFGSFVNALFRPNPFSENPFFRGFYFTSAPGTKGSGNVPVTVGNTYFTERLFKDVILRDRDVVRTFQAQQQRAPIFGWVMTFIGAMIVLGLLGLTAVSLVSNKQMLDEAASVGDKGLALRRADLNRDILTKKEDEVREELRVLEGMRPMLATLDDNNRNGAPLYMRMGMYSGNGIYLQSLLPLYMNLVEKRFKQPAIRKLEAELKQFAESGQLAGRDDIEREASLNKNYNLLKAYLMLSDGSQQIDGKTVRYREKAEATHIAATLREYWLTESKVPNDMKATAEMHLDFWSRQIDRAEGLGEFPRIQLNAKLVDEARRKLQAFPAVNRYYSNQVSRISREIDDKIGPTTVESMVARGGADTSLLTGTYRVPGAFTRPGFELMKTAIAEADSKLAEDDWVMGELGKRQLVQAQATDAAKLEDLYYRDYADHWRKFVRGTQLRSFEKRSDAVDAFQVLSSANSPMKRIVIEVENNTNLSKKIDGGGWLDWIFSFFSKKKEEGPGNTQPEKEFRPVTTFVGKPEQGENAPIEKYQSELQRVYTKLSTVNDDQFRRAIEEMANEKDPLDVNKREQAVNGLVSAFNETPAGQEVATLLQQPILNLKNLLGAGVKQQIERTWRDSILPDAKALEALYPFADGQQEADFETISRFLSPTEGKLSKFYDERLKNYFEEVGGQLKPRDTADMQFTDEFVAYLNNAFALRRAFFGSSPTPKFDYEFSLKPSPDAVIEVSIDGQKITSEGTGSIRGTFPAAQSSETGVAINLVSTAASSANTSTGTTTATSAPPFAGKWGLFRFVEASKPQKQASGEYLLSISAGGKSIGATIKSSSGDLFDKQTFQKVKAPDKALK